MESRRDILRRAYQAAEWHLYNYQMLKRRLAKVREEAEADAVSAQYGRQGYSTPVKSSKSSSSTERAAIKLAAAVEPGIDATIPIWISAIEDVWCMLTHEEPLKAEFMERVFALTGRPHGLKSKGYVRDVVMIEMDIDNVSTFYIWKKSIINDVVYSALSRSLLRHN